MLCGCWFDLSIKNKNKKMLFKKEKKEVLTNKCTLESTHLKVHTNKYTRTHRYTLTSTHPQVSESTHLATHLARL